MSVVNGIITKNNYHNKTTSRGMKANNSYQWALTTDSVGNNMDFVM